ncbi:MAG TPA: D-glycero-beta-D-manno-heptose 1-phosphate adenylyltransferase [Syntrophales bacterium]|nr:D-glycero-beta-D-manno-heptose 1-phosphate adenylyltransferase [Syntrophales bacterium]
MEKILSREALGEAVDRLRREGRKIAFTNGCFDILHVGHVQYLEAARREADVLIVAVNSDASVRAIKGEKRPLVPEGERAAVVAGLAAVDFVTLFSERTPLDLIQALRPDVILKGGDWKEEDVVGRDAVLAWGGRVVIIPETAGASTTNLVAKILETYGRP